MKHIAIFFFLLFPLFAADSFAQGYGYPEGVYMSFQEIADKAPSMQYDVTLQERADKQSDVTGGNEFELLSEEESVKDRFLKNRVYAYSDGRDMYVNTKKFLGEPGYSKVLSDGRYMVFPVYVNEGTGAVFGMSLAFGLVGGLVAAAATADLHKEMLFVYDKYDTVNEVKAVNNVFLKKAIKVTSKKLLMQYKEEPRPLPVDVQLYYLDIINQLWIEEVISE